MLFNKKNGINFRLMLAIVIIITGLSFTLGFIGLRITNGFVQKKFMDRVQFLARYLAINSEVGVLIGDRASLHMLANNVLGEEDVAGIKVFDRQNNALVEVSRYELADLPYSEMPVVFKKSGDENVLFQNRADQVRESDSDIGLIGRVQVYYSTKGIEQLVFQITWKYIAASLILSILSLMIYYFLSRPIVLEVADLASVASQIGSGNSLLRATPGKISETRELAVAFNSMLDSLDRSREALTLANRKMLHQRLLAEIGKFSLIIAHELKNPLAIIKSSLDLLKKDFEIPADNVLLVYIEDEIKRLNGLIEDFLLFARPVEPLFKRVDMNAVVSDICDRFSLIYPESEVSFSFNVSDKPAFADADRDLITRSISNVFKNACEAAGDKGHVKIETRCQDGYWILEIADDGNGISENDICRIFDPFFTTKSKGTGLGLSFVAQVIASHAGTIFAENNDSGGALFRIKIPVIDGVDQQNVFQK